MVYLVVGATLVTVYLYQITTVKLGSEKVSSYTYLIPALVAILLFFIDGVPVQMAIIFGILISSIATVILQKNILVIKV